MMERSSQFVSLSGLSGVFSGFVGLAAACIAYVQIYGAKFSFSGNPILERACKCELVASLEILALCAVLFAIGGALFFTIRKSKNNKLPLWGNTSKRFVVNLAIPLVAGGLFCIVLLVHHHLDLIASAMLLFYGLSLINAGHFTQNDIGYLGIVQVALGLLAATFPYLGLLFWALGFGIAHLVYGTIMYKKYK